MCVERVCVLRRWKRFAEPSHLDGDCVEKAELLRVNVDLAQSWESIKADGGIERHSGSLIESTLSLKSGESAVVGVSKMGGSDKGLILIISGKVIK